LFTQYDRSRLEELSAIEEANFLTLTQMPDSNLEDLEQTVTLLEPEQEAEKKQLLAAGFDSWSKTDFTTFVKAAAQYGKTNHIAIAADVGKPDEEVRRYAQAFWSVGQQRMPAEQWDKSMAKVDAGKKKLEAVQGMIEATRKKVERFENPWETMTFKTSRGVKVSSRGG
jgi:SWI/SNF-related matrix-associated actin-dependent regulator of chromatin subfamily A member 5